MKKSSIELKKELNDVYKELDWLHKHYPFYTRRKHSGVINPLLPKEIRDRYEFLWARLRNLKININQALWKEFGSDIRQSKNAIKLMNNLKINQKVYVPETGEVGTITALYPPCDTHSGRIIVYIHSKTRSYYTEFWYSEVGKNLIVKDLTGE